MQQPKENHLQPAFGHIQSFDSIRGIAVLLVLMLHGSFSFFKGGWIGVDLFFVLSGYLISSLLQKEYQQHGKISISKFYVRRALRLFPPLIICVILANLLWSVSEPYYFEHAHQKTATIAALLYFTNFINGDLSGNLGHLWSLSVEEHFYLFWPVLTSFFLLRISLIKEIVFLLLLILAVGIFRIYAFNVKLNYQLFGHLLEIDSYRFTFCRIDGILTGALLSFIMLNSNTGTIIIKDRTATWLLLFLAAAFFFVFLKVEMVNHYWRNGGFIITNLLCALTIFIAAQKPTHYLLSSKVLGWVGVRSYGIYLYHIPLFFFFQKFSVPHSTLNVILVFSAKFSLAFLLAYLSFKYVEQPVLKLKHRFK